MRSNYWYSREQQKKAYRAHLIRQYAIWIGLIILVGGAAWLL